MRAIVTRPRAQAIGWVESLRARGIDAVALPLISIGPAPDSGAVAAAWTTLAERRLVVFVSANAVHAFFDAAPSGSAWPTQTRAAGPGPGTTEALLEHGVAATQIDSPASDAPQFDSEALWARLERRDWRDASVLAVRGTVGRDWLAARLAEGGARVDQLAAYTRVAPILDRDERRILEMALRAPRQHLWLFSSSEAIAHLEVLGAAGATDAAGAWRQARALATHPRIAARARALGFSEVVETRPTLDATVACIQSLRP